MNYKVNVEITEEQLQLFCENLAIDPTKTNFSKIIASMNDPERLLNAVEVQVYEEGPESVGIE